MTSGITNSEIEELVDNLEEEIKLPRNERSIGLDYDEMNFILEAIAYYKEFYIG